MAAGIEGRHCGKESREKEETEEEGGLRGRMFHFAFQACATVDEEGGEDVGSE